jgi:hypothetical protein
MKVSSPFVALTMEGGLFPAEFLNKVAHFEAKHQRPEDYRLARGLQVREEIERAWRIAQAEWRAYRDARRRVDIAAPALAQDWLARLLKMVLGYEDVACCEPCSAGGRTFALSHTAEQGRIPLLLVAPSFALDKGAPEFGEVITEAAPTTRRRSPHALLQEYLNAAEGPVWGLVGNGDTLRLVRENPSLTRPAYIEADLATMFEEENFADFAVFWLLFHASRVIRGTDSVLESWREAAHETGVRALAELRAGVIAALRQLGTGVVAHPENAALRARLETGGLSLDAFFQQLLRLVYRLIFLLTAEDRELLHAPDSEGEARALYHIGYSASRLRERALRSRFHDAYGDLWETVRIVFEGLATGCAPLALPALGGLFRADQCPDVMVARLANQHLLGAVRVLAYFATGETLSRVNFRDQDSEELGSVYESLLELHPRLYGAGALLRFGFLGADNGDVQDTTVHEDAAVRGSERKRSGSYYTPDSLVQELIKSALEPVIARTLADHPGDPREALLQLKVCDPACGSGHFLLAAARRLAHEVARVEAITDAPDEVVRRHALREVVAHCIYGVDKNPLAVELCKTALWLEALEPGRPLGFLDHHIRCGDALVGVVDGTLPEAGVPPDAYKSLTGDDKEVCQRLARENREARKALQKERERVAVTEVLEFYAAPPVSAYETLPEEDLRQVEAKATAWHEAECRAHDSRTWRLSDLFVAAFFTPKTQGRGDLCPTTRDLHRVMQGVPARAGVSEAARDVAEKVQAFHWPLAFPEVFAHGGFDVVLGNPPWERVKLQEEEFFASRSERIAQASNKAERARLIVALATGDASDCALYHEFLAARYAAEAASQFVHSSGRYPLTGVGDVNTYALFAETFIHLVKPDGRAGFIVPSGIAADYSTKAFFEAVSTEGRLASLFDFENRKQLFPSVDSRQKFCLMTLGQDIAQARFVFFATDVAQLSDARRRFTLSPDDILRINPNTKTAPVFRSERDAELTKAIYRRVPVLVREGEPDGNPWGLEFMRMFDMSNDSGLFRTATQRGELSRPVPLYEAKMVHQFDHRWATYADGGGGARDVTDGEKADASFQVQPRYWVEEREVLLRLARLPRPVLKVARDGDEMEVRIALASWVAAYWLGCGEEPSRKRLGQVLGSSYADIPDDWAAWKALAPLALEQPPTEEDFRLIRESDTALSILDELLDAKSPRWLMGWRDIARSTDERTVIASVVPMTATGDTLLLMFPNATETRRFSGLLADQNSLVHDFVARQKVGGTHLKYHVKKQVPVLPSDYYAEERMAFIAPRVTELTYTTRDLKPWAEDLGYTGNPFPWDVERRAMLRAELDAYYARLYGLTRDELRYILDPADIMGEDYPSETFRVLREKELRAFGEYRTRRLVLEAWDRLPG